MTISRCCAVRPVSAPGPAGAACAVTPQCAQFGFGAPGPRFRAEAAERFEGVPEDGLASLIRRCVASHSP
jgi:hypothetical protein